MTTLTGIARALDGGAGLLLGRGSLEMPNERIQDFHTFQPFAVELDDGRRVVVEPDADTHVVVPATLRPARVDRLRAACPEYAHLLEGEDDDDRLSHRWTLIRPGDRVAVLASGDGPYRAEAIAVEQQALRRLQSGEDARLTLLGVALMAFGIAWMAATRHLAWSRPVIAVGLGVLLSGTLALWAAFPPPRPKGDGLDILVVGAVFAVPFLSWLLWPLSWLLPVVLWRRSAKDAAALRSIAQARIARTLTVHSDVSSLPGTPLIVGGMPHLPRRGTALVAGDAVLVVPAFREAPVERWLRRRALVLLLLSAFSLGGVAFVAFF